MKSGLLCFALLAAAAAQEPPANLLRQALADVGAGHYPAALREATSAAAAFQHSGDHVNEGRALRVAGLAQLYSSQYPLALASFTGAFRIAQETHDTDGEVTCLNNIGTVFYFQGHYSDAFERYREAMRRVNAIVDSNRRASRRQLTTANMAILYQTLGQFERALDLYSGLLESTRELPPQEQAQVLANVGALRRRLGDPQKALDTYRQAQALYRRAAHRDGEIAVLNNIGIVQGLDLRDYAAAARTFSKALELAQASGDRSVAVQSLLYRGEALYRSGQLDASAADFAAAEAGAQALGASEELWKALYGLARTARARGQDTASAALLKRAIAVIESMRAGLAVSSLRSEFLADKRDVYDLSIEQTKDADELFHLMEQSRARNLKDRRRSSVQDLRAFERSLPADTAVLEYWLGPSSGLVLWITSSEAGTKRWGIAGQAGTDIANAARAMTDASRRDWRTTVRPLATELLPDIPPLSNARIHHVIVIPDGGLSALPFEALPINAAELMVERFAVSYSPSAALALEQSTQASRIVWPWQTELQAFADPAPGPRSAGFQYAAARSWPRLTEARTEVAGIARELGGKAGLFVGDRARKDILKTGHLAPILHLATHAYADMQDPGRSYILLAPAKPDQAFDYLFLSEVYDLHLDGMSLATVSACETDAGKTVRGEGVESFSRAFLAAGARSVVTSLWPVGDRTTAQIMLRFYARLAKGAPKAEALRQTKLEFLRNPASSHPAYWAAFVLNGDANSRIPFAIGWVWFAAPAILLIGALVLLRRRAKTA